MICNTDLLATPRHSPTVAYFAWFGSPMGDGEAAQAGIGALEDPPDRHSPSVADDEPTLQGAETID